MTKIFLIGMMGSGKSTIGKLLSQRLEYSFLDTDDCILESSCFSSISEIFEVKGESYFRRIECERLNELPVGNYVIATGGGIIIADENIQSMKNQGIVIYLSSTIDNLVNNLSESSDRPLLNEGTIEIKLRNLLKDRLENYQRASDYQVDVSFKDKNAIVEEIINELSKKCEV